MRTTGVHNVRVTSAASKRCQALVYAVGSLPHTVGYVGSLGPGLWITSVVTIRQMRTSLSPNCGTKSLTTWLYWEYSLYATLIIRDFDSRKSDQMADVAVFVSYCHDDNEASYDRIIKISNDTRRVYKSLTGLEVGLFIDTESINLGDQWRERIRSGLTNATILLAFISPLYLASAPCREEFQSFVWTASEADSRKLIIPLLFTPKENIEERFQHDELWAQIVELQYLEINELRKSDPGSVRWMEKVEIITDGMRNVLSIPDLNVPPPRGPIQVPESARPEPGAFDQLREMEQTLQPFNETIQELASITQEYNDRVVAATPPMAAATTFSDKLAVANKLADDLTPITEKFSGRVQDFQRQLNIIDPGIRTIFRMYRANPANQQDDDTRGTIRSIKTLAENSLAGIESILQFSQSIEGTKGYSSRLDTPLQRMQSAMLVMAGNRGIFADWLGETVELGFGD
jgi:hypothetical protein